MNAAIIQARMGSTRLPDKVLADIEGVPLIGRVIERTRAVRGIDTVVVATTTGREDDTLADYVSRQGVTVVRGSSDDVLARYQQAARAVDAATVMRITADDPFKDPDVCGLVLSRFIRAEGSVDYVSNTVELSYPEGLDVEVFSREALERAAQEANLPSEREHVTPYIYKRPDAFRIEQVVLDRDLSSLRWTLDYPEDLVFARAVYERLSNKPMFLMDDVLSLLAREPHLAALNQGFVRNAGYHASLASDPMR